MSDDALSELLQENTTYRTDTIESRLEDHDERITRNEKFRLLVTGALMVISFMIGSGFVVLLLTNLVF